MIKLQTYAGLSLVATLAVIYHAFNSRGQFYPATVYLSTSKISLVLLLNMGLVIMCILWQLTKRVFLGSLREAEVERLNEQSWREVMEILFAITIFRQDFSVTFLAMVTALLLIKALHWLAQKRVEYIETTPSVPMLSHIRILYGLDLDLLRSENKFKQVKTDSMWQGKLIAFHSCAFHCLGVDWNYGVPLHLIRELYETFRNFRVRIADYIRYRKMTSNMNDRFPDATPEELDASDATCIICREEMVTAKKLICGHLFHMHCLRSWLERQHTCPTCRALVVPPENGTTTAGGQHGPRSDFHQASTSTQGLTGDVADDNLNWHRARLQAAASAAAIYEKSFVYPSPNTLVWSPGYVSLPQASGATMNYGDRLSGDLNIPGSQMEAQKKFLEYHIEVLQNQLQLLQKLSKPEEGMGMAPTASSAGKGKDVASSSSSVPDSGHHGEIEETDT
ncbi:ERAD-associated E3 ubiquitin-protein ligase HRD1B [Vitis vinifera]|uniref:RING-type E3 ubiquitin transferase n=1 Tax=Vitis vinifera TaxID=29760 RepID=A0A438IYB9_VITVI|nr:ERAD-associated E3 ubiquitin-protein ligase HRD1B [Vitis vinifera]